MLPDLTDKKIQPKQWIVEKMPEISLSETLRERIRTDLKANNAYFVQVLDHTTIVETSKNNFVFFSNQWFIHAIMCREYALAIRKYADCYEKNLGNDTEKIKLLAGDNYNSDEAKKIIRDDSDRCKMHLFLTPEDKKMGKKTVTENSIREPVDIFSSRVLKKLPITNASAGYLGNLIYCLSANEELYLDIEKELFPQLEMEIKAAESSISVKDYAKQIVDSIYKYDGFNRISRRFRVLKKNIKIDTKDTDGLLPNGNWLRYMFALPESEMYDPEDRVFGDVYSINCNNATYNCKLTTEWVGLDVENDSKPNNYLQALIKLVNRDYAGVFNFEENPHVNSNVKQDFLFNELPDSFDKEYLRRYVTSLLAKPFVILTGNSGTGKTRIAKQFAEYLEVMDSPTTKNILIVPVGADWTDNTKVMGFYNPIANNGAGSYEKTDIIEFIERANINYDIPYFLILDEMNLSHVERYFSDFLSHMEIPDKPFELHGYNNVSKTNKGILPYPKNLFVIGTVNIDETTYMFSPKVLDRANVIEFKPYSEDVLNKFFVSGQNQKIIPAKTGVAESFLRLAKLIRSGVSNLPDGDLTIITETFSKIYNITEEYGYEFAYRTVKEISQYISAAFEISDEWDATILYSVIDEQLLQKVLPKIHGNKKEIGDMLDALETVCSYEGKELTKSKMKIKQMKRKLSTVQYASYI